MPAVIPIAVAAIGAAGSIGGAALSSQGAKKAAAAGKGREHQFPLPRYQRGFEKYYTRLLAENLKSVPPSFADYIKSGGTATFPIQDPGISPKEAKELGLVGPKGLPVPFSDINQTSQLTPEQQLYLGYIGATQGKHGPLERAYQWNRRTQIALGKEQTPERIAKEEKFRRRRDRLLGPITGVGGPV